MSLYYDSSLLAHEHKPTVDDKFRHLENERQWLLVESGRKKLALLRLEHHQNSLD